MCYTGHQQEDEEVEGVIRGTGKHILNPLWKIEDWKMETGRTDNCGN
jgi:hypothetical protein